jgi:hypothetical protein
MAFSIVYRLSPAESVDYTNTRTLLIGVAQLLVVAGWFALLFVVVAAFRLATLDPTPESKVLSVVLGIGPGIALGGGVPVLVQQWAWVARAARRPAAEAIGPALTFGTYGLLFVYDPVSSVLYAGTYLASRGASLCGIFGVARVRTALG